MQSFSDVWEKAMTLIEPQVTSVSFNSWIKLLNPVKMENNVAFFYVRTLFQKGTIENNFSEIIEKALTDTMGFPVRASIITEDEAPPRIIEQAKPREKQFNEVMQQDQDYLSSPMSKLTFENFVVGAENKFAHAASVSVANNPGTGFNPLFIYGRSGLGKTHLMCAIANELRRNDPDINILYIKCEDFINDLVESLQKGKMAQFRKKYRFVDAFLVDDIQFIAGKEQTQEEFFHTFEALHEASKQIILTSDRPPKDILPLTDRLRTRFEMGVMADIQPPQFETRCAIIKNKADSLGLELSDNVVEFIAKKLHTNVRELEGAINKIKAYNMLYNEKPSLVTAQNAVASVISESRPTSVTVDMIIDNVCRYYYLSADDIRGKSHKATIVRARHICMYIARQMTALSLKEIGENFSSKDHTTVLHAIKNIEADIEKDPKLKQDISEQMENIKKSF